MMNTFQDPKEMKLLLRYTSLTSNNGSWSRNLGIIDDMRRWEQDRFQESKVYWPGTRRRSKRVLRLIFANILAHCDDPPSQRPPKIESSLPLYQTNAGDPPAAHLVAERDHQMV